MPWKKLRKNRDLPTYHYLRVLGKITPADFEIKYERLGQVLGDAFLKTILNEISNSLQQKRLENILAFKQDVYQAISTLNHFSLESNLHTGYPGQKMLRDFVEDKHLEVDEHVMLRIISHCLFSLSVDLHEMRTQ